ncbi:hypothetical protein PILCRDRAFT_743695 [Piloderma croceum F 1598]|uniref:Clathrin/coatomer adaptor adaptin-like N-terminal domain-containing protein n=1 Tax=Piloderma croceum (strain F 1598) TaxID=765440 RepID=A0A0C3EW78_PILCF|nr:hypothetical protein PILCRDRAFT_743695 [Piloderma croceum F 1598]
MELSSMASDSGPIVSRASHTKPTFKQIYSRRNLPFPQRRRTPRTAGPDLPLLLGTSSFLRAVFAVYAIYRGMENLVPDARELLQTLAAASGATCKRNAFVFLAHCAIPKVVEWILSVYEQISGLAELLQMSVNEVIRLDRKNDSAYRARYIRCIFELLNTLSHAVKYKAAITLMTLTQNMAAVKAAASCFINLALKTCALAALMNT